MAITFHFLKRTTLSKRNDLKAFLKKIAHQKGFKIETLNVVFCSDKYLLDINKTFLKHNYFTDVITFDLSNEPQKINGEIYISIDTVIQNAQNHHQTIKKEIHRVIFHGLLHLCGYKDKKLIDKKEMTNQENKYLELYFS